MTAIVVKSFNGMKPLTDSVLLDNADAQTASNVFLNSGTINPLKSLTVLADTQSGGPLLTIFQYDPNNEKNESKYWLEFTKDTDIMRSPIAQDQWKRLYWTDVPNGPRYAPEDHIIQGYPDDPLPGPSFLLGVPKPTVKPEITDSTAVVEVVTVGRSYCLTFWNGTKESAPGKAWTVQAVDGEPVNFTNLTTDNRGDTSITHKRLYRKIPDGTNPKLYRRIAEIALDETEYEDKTKDADALLLPVLPLANSPSAPQYPPIVSADAVSGSTATSRMYYYTLADFVDGGNQYAESPPSPPRTVTADLSQTVTLSGFVNPSSKAKSYKIYRQDAGLPQPLYIQTIPATPSASYDDPIGLTKTGGPLGGYTGPPSTAPVAALTATISTSEVGVTVNRLYMVTFVDGSGNESPKSPDSEVLIVIDGVTAVALVHSEPIPSGVAKKRLYRQDITIASGIIATDDANWKMVAENTASATSATDIKATADLPGVSYPTVLHNLPPSPLGKPTTKSEIPATVIAESRVYCFTYVTAYDEEGPPSDSSDVVSIDPAKDVTVVCPGGPPSGAYNIAIKRIYRSATGSQRTKFQFVGEMPVSETDFLDTKKTSELLEILPSEGWIAPPVGLQGLRLMANGAAVGFVGNSLYFSEPNLPHAWPHEYPINETIIAIGVFGQTVAVLTNTYPYLFQGIDPGAMASMKLQLPQACVAKRSVVETGDGVIYASPDGLTMLGQGATLMTQAILSRNQWQAYKPESMECFLYNNRIFITYDLGTSRGMLIFDMSGNSAMFTTSNVNATFPFTAGYYSPKNDTLYFAQKLAAKTQIVRFDRGAPMYSAWKSKKFRLPKPDNFGFAQVICKSYATSTILFVFADGVQKYMKSVTSRSEFRLPGGFLATDWEFEIQGYEECTEMFIASSSAELQSA